MAAAVPTAKAAVAVWKKERRSLTTLSSGETVFFSADDDDRGEVFVVTEKAKAEEVHRRGSTQRSFIVLDLLSKVCEEMSKSNGDEQE